MTIAKEYKEKVLKEFNDEGIVVNGCLIKNNSVYIIKPKEPKLAPEVYKLHLQSEKERLPGVMNVKRFGAYNGLYDTGFHTESYLFKKMRIDDYQEREELVKKYYTIFVEPILNRISPEDREKFTDPNAYAFFEGDSKELKPKYKDVFKCSLYEGRQFNINDPLDRFHLYLAIVSDGLVEKGSRTSEEKQQKRYSEGDAKYAQYVYTTKSGDKTREDEAILIKSKALENFYLLKASDKTSLVRMLNYSFSSINVDTTLKDDVLTIAFNKYVTDHIEFKEKCRVFNKIVDEYNGNKELLKRKLEVYDIIKKNATSLTKKGKVVLLNKELGSVKSAVEKIIGDAALYTELIQITDSD